MGQKLFSIYGVNFAIYSVPIEKINREIFTDTFVNFGYPPKTIIVDKENDIQKLKVYLYMGHKLFSIYGITFTKNTHFVRKSFFIHIFI